MSLYLGPHSIVERQIDRMSVIEEAADPLSQFLYALKAPETKRQWPNRLKVVFDFLGFPGSLNEQSKQFMTLCKEGRTALVQDRIIEFISYQVQRSLFILIGITIIILLLSSITKLKIGPVELEMQSAGERPPTPI